jgi:hypothetical protein
MFANAFIYLLRPVKKKNGAAGIPRPSGERSSPVANGIGGQQVRIDSITHLIIVLMTSVLLPFPRHLFRSAAKWHLPAQGWGRVGGGWAGCLGAIHVPPQHLPTSGGNFTGGLPGLELPADFFRNTSAAHTTTNYALHETHDY